HAAERRYIGRKEIAMCLMTSRTFAPSAARALVFIFAHRCNDRRSCCELILASHGGPIDRPIAERNALKSSQRTAAAASRNTCSPSYQCAIQPRASAAPARAWRYITESATFAARVLVIRSSIVGGRLEHTRMAMLAIGVVRVAASSSRLARAKSGRYLHP